jgi:hypothetical protein
MALEWRSWRFTPGGDRRFYACSVDQRQLRIITDRRLRPLRRRAAIRGPFRSPVRRKRSGRGAQLMSFSVDNAAGGPGAQCARAWDPSNGGDRAAVKLNDRSTMMRRRTGKTNDMTAGSRRFASHATQTPPRHSRRDAKKRKDIVAIPQAVPEPPLRASSDSSERD